MPAKKARQHKRGCRCVVCEHKRRKRNPSGRRKTVAKKKTAARKRNGITTGTIGKWVRAKAIRVRKVAGKLLVDVRN